VSRQRSNAAFSRARELRFPCHFAAEAQVICEQDGDAAIWGFSISTGEEAFTRCFWPVYFGLPGEIWSEERMTKRVVREKVVRENSAAITGAMTSQAAVMDEVMDSTSTVELTEKNSQPPTPARKLRAVPSPTGPKRFPATHVDDVVANRQAELFYLQKQIQQQTQMIFVMEDGARVQGVVEWYDRHSIKVRGKARVLIYKAAIKYLYKAGEIGSTPGE
jgi:sRNA-binding regulator protein Hfq